VIQFAHARVSVHGLAQFAQRRRQWRQRLLGATLGG